MHHIPMTLNCEFCFYEHINTTEMRRHYRNKHGKPGEDVKAIPVTPASVKYMQKGHVRPEKEKGIEMERVGEKMAKESRQKEYEERRRREGKRGRWTGTRKRKTYRGTRERRYHP